jgi:hypothetical protein
VALQFGEHIFFKYVLCISIIHFQKDLIPKKKKKKNPKFLGTKIKFSPYLSSLAKLDKPQNNG